MKTDRCACGLVFAQDDFSSVRCDACQEAASINVWLTERVERRRAMWPTTPLGHTLLHGAVLETISDADLGMLASTQEWLVERKGEV